MIVPRSWNDLRNWARGLLYVNFFLLSLGWASFANTRLRVATKSQQTGLQGETNNKARKKTTRQGEKEQDCKGKRTKRQGETNKKAGGTNKKSRGNEQKKQGERTKKAGGKQTKRQEKP